MPHSCTGLSLFPRCRKSAAANRLTVSRERTRPSAKLVRAISSTALIACLAPERNVDTAIVDRLVEGIGILGRHDGTKQERQQRHIILTAVAPRPGNVGRGNGNAVPFAERLKTDIRTIRKCIEQRARIDAEAHG